MYVFVLVSYHSFYLPILELAHTGRDYEFRPQNLKIFLKQNDICFDYCYDTELILANCDPALRHNGEIPKENQLFEIMQHIM